jgi:hypothetical protein
MLGLFTIKSNRRSNRKHHEYKELWQATVRFCCCAFVSGTDESAISSASFSQTALNIEFGKFFAHLLDNAVAMI